MPMRKAGTRFTDRNTIKRMHAQGYDLEQICTAVSVLPKNVQEVIDGAFERKGPKTREMSLEDAKKMVADAEAFEAAEEAAEEAGKAFDVAEFEEAQAASEQATADEAEEAAVEEEAAAEPPVDEVTEPETPPATRRPRRKKAEASDDG